MQSYAERINLEVQLHPESYANCIQPFTQTRGAIGSDTELARSFDEQVDKQRNVVVERLIGAPRVKMEWYRLAAKISELPG